jgi:hypothetical protein
MKRLFALLCILGAMALATGCGDHHAAGQLGGASNYSYDRVMNALVGPEAIDVAASHGSVSAQDLAIGGLTLYIEGSYGSTSITAQQSGTSTTVAGPTNVVLDQSLHDTVAVCGILGTSGVTAPQIKVFQDPQPAASSVSSTSFQIRLVNLSPDSGMLSLYGTPVTNSPPGEIGIGDVSYLNSSGYVLCTPNTAVQPETFQLALYDVSGATPTPIITDLSTNGFAFTITTSYTAWVVGMRHPGTGQQPLHLVFTNDTEGTILPSTGSNGQ